MLLTKTSSLPFCLQQWHCRLRAAADTEQGKDVTLRNCSRSQTKIEQMDLNWFTEIGQVQCALLIR